MAQANCVLLVLQSKQHLQTQRERTPPMRTNGTVKFFDQTRGFGFITPEGGNKDVFVHITALSKAGIESLNEGDKVSFDVEDDSRGRGKQAANLQMA